ncbi:MAG: hypothetical protein EAY81_04775 [Bacteroidetes bacterium]|nr:MAG: hypothetical protein EAY81_04775 [Bacteroidota bacterium]
MLSHPIKALSIWTLITKVIQTDEPKNTIIVDLVAVGVNFYLAIKSGFEKPHLMYRLTVFKDQTSAQHAYPNY